MIILGARLIAVAIFRFREQQRYKALLKERHWYADAYHQAKAELDRLKPQNGVLKAWHESADELIKSQRGLLAIMRENDRAREESQKRMRQSLERHDEPTFRSRLEDKT